MNSFPILDLSIRDIDVPADRARDYDDAGAQMLAGIIAAQGLHHPIRVRRTGGRYSLISGLMRLRAFELLQRETIPASLSEADSDEAARLEEVMENLGRSELIALDRCHHLYELKQAWEAGKARPLSEVLTNEGGTTCSTGPEETEVFGFARSVADQVGLSKQKINMAIKIWADLAPASRLRLVGTKLATKQTELKALSEEPAPRQAKILDLILGDARPDIENVAAALAYLENGIQPTALERKFRALSDGIKSLPDESLDLLLVENEARVIASLKRRGRI